MSQNTPNYEFQIALIGDSGVGKTSFLSRLVENEFSATSAPSIFSSFKKYALLIEDKSISVNIYDNPGNKTYRSIVSDNLSGKDGCIIFYDVTNRQSFDSLVEWVDIVISNNNFNGNVMITGTKIDKKDGKVVTTEEAFKFASKNNFLFSEISSSEEDSVKNSFTYFIAQIYHQKKEEKLENFLLNIEDFQKVELISGESFYQKFKIINKKTGKYYEAKEFNSADDNFWNDVRIYPKISNPLIVEFIGYSKIGFNKDKSLIVTEYFPNGTLDDAIKNNTIEKWTSTTKINVIYGIAKAMSFLHSKNVIYHNLKPSNVMLDEDFYPKIGCLELGVITSEISIEENIIVETLMYLAPEVIESNEYSEASDVFAFAMILYEVFNGSSPLTKFTPHRAMKFILSGERPPFNTDIQVEIKELIEACWKQVPSERLTFDGIIQILDSIDSEAYLSFIKNTTKKIKAITNEDDNLNQKSIKNTIICTCCDKKIEEENEVIYISGFKYHLSCIKCSICNKKIETDDDFDHFICITPGLFLCIDDYEEYKKTKQLPENVLNEYRERLSKNLVKELFTPIILNFDEDVSKYPEDEVFIDSEMISNCHFLSKYYKYFVPTVTFHFNIHPKLLKINEIFDILPPEMIIVSIEKGSTFLTIAFIATGELQITKEKHSEIIDQVYDKLKSAWGDSIVGEKPEINLPNKYDINNIVDNEIVNSIQNTEILNQINFDDIRDEVQQLISKRKHKDWKFIFDHYEMFESATEQICEDIKKNPFEMIIIGQTIIASNFFKKYEDIKRNILNAMEKEKNDKNENEKEKFERFLYHGTRLSNHPNIAKIHFLMPGKDKVRTTDQGFFGKGIYATNSIIYASLYGNGFHRMNESDKASVFCCQTIYNPKYVKDIKDDADEELVANQPLSEELCNNYGIHRALVGDRHLFHAIEEDKQDDSVIVAYEYVFPNKYQIIPVCSFNVMRKELYILWADENKKYIEQSNELKRIIIPNVYYSDNGEEIYQIVERKQKNKIKLILSYENEENAKSIIDGIRSCYGSYFACLIFSENTNQIEFAKSMTNVLFTNKFEDLLTFANLKMEVNDYIEFSQKLENDYKNNKFDIDETTIVDFPNLSKFDIRLIMNKTNSKNEV